MIVISLDNQAGAGLPSVKKRYRQPWLRALGELRTLTLGGSQQEEGDWKAGVPIGGTHCNWPECP